MRVNDSDSVIESVSERDRKEKRDRKWQQLHLSLHTLCRVSANIGRVSKFECITGRAARSDRGQTDQTDQTEVRQRSDRSDRGQTDQTD